MFLKILTMSTQAEPIPTPPTPAMRNTVGKGNEKTLENPNMPAFDAALREYCDKHYHQLLPLIAENVHQEKAQQDKLKEVKAHLSFEGCSRRNSKIQEASQHSESRTPNLRGEPGKRRRSRRSHSMSKSPKPTPNVFFKIRRDMSESPRHRDSKRKTVFTMLEKNERGVFNRLGVKEEVYPHTPVTLNPNDTGTPKGKRRAVTRVLRMEAFSESKDSGGGHWKSRSKKQKSGVEEDDLSQPWVCEETDPFTPHIRYFDFPKKTRMPSNVKTYDGSEDPEDHLKIFQAAAKVEHWAMPTRCHMFTSTLTGSARVWFDDLSLESVDSYKETFLANFLQQNKCIKDPIEIHHIK
ncbi:hypothetical protein Tco_0995448 [Tanacetum coccineum]